MPFDFDSDEYTAPKIEGLPIAQVFSPYFSKKTKTIQPYGFGMTIDHASSVEFEPDESFQLVDNYTFDSGDTSSIYLATTPSMVIVHRSKLLAEIRKGNPDEGTIVEVPQGGWDKLKHKPVQRQIVFFVGKNKQLLHKTPLVFTTKGAAGGSFSNHYAQRERGRLAGGFCYELQEAYTQSKGQKGRKMHTSFFAHGIFSVTLKDEERGEGNNTALVCATTDHEVPNTANWENYLIETGSSESNTIKAAYEEYQDYFNKVGHSIEFNEVGGITESEIIYSEDGEASCNFLLTYYRNNETFQLFCNAKNGLAEQAANADSATDYRVKGVKEGKIVTVKSLETEVVF